MFLPTSNENSISDNSIYKNLDNKQSQSGRSTVIMKPNTRARAESYDFQIGNSSPQYDDISNINYKKSSNSQL